MKVKFLIDTQRGFSDNIKAGEVREIPREEFEAMKQNNLLVEEVNETSKEVKPEIKTK